ncbi:hypothetical protein M422DRAFT_254651 [Sphaerobolus stellatus SS14]|uniref:DUF6533 domain-containing protein n=1 Tax=Sphaerobolus stellatus (strain SS14) TaxID=990650 RepID=A0A0C9VUI4_SPHS4|nr:hypothetical protein M422DRAFT_254651 [Sphaerobolus stellatus SS14]
MLTAGTTDIRSDELAQAYAALAGLVLLVYDTLLTLDTEIEIIWKRRPRFGSTTDIGERWKGHKVCIFKDLCLFHFLTAQHPSCGPLNIIFQALIVPTGFSLYALLLTRAYAISRRNIWVIITLGPFVIATLVLTLLAVLFGTCEPRTPENHTRILNIRRSYQIANSIVLMSFDAGLLFITIYYTWTLHKARKNLNQTQQHVNLASELIRHGLVRYLLIFAWSLETPIVVKFLRPSLTGIETPIRGSSCIIMGCRFYLELMAGLSHYVVDGRSDAPVTDNIPTLTAMIFAGGEETTMVVPDSNDEIAENYSFNSHATRDNASGRSSLKIGRPCMICEPIIDSMTGEGNSSES